MTEFLLEKKLKKHKEYYDSWSNLVNKYAPILDQGALFGDESYTPHGYTNHCLNIYRHLATILPKSFYKGSGSELYILMVSVLLHDYVMSTQNDSESRDRHSLLCKEMIYRHYDIDYDTSLADNIKREYSEYIGDVIWAHSDEKAPKRLNTLEEVIRKYTTLGTINDDLGKEIRVPILAAYLRLADELDVTYARLEGTNYKEQKKTQKSKPHFDKLTLFSTISIENNYNHIALKVNNRSKLLSDKNQYATALILEVYDKVKASFDEVQEKVFSRSTYRVEDWKYNDVILLENGVDITLNHYAVVEKYRNILNVKKKN